MASCRLARSTVRVVGFHCWYLRQPANSRCPGQLILVLGHLLESSARFLDQGHEHENLQTGVHLLCIELLLPFDSCPLQGGEHSLLLRVHEGHPSR